jgi:hypothetical protein
MDVHSPDRFTAWTGVGRLALEDNMTVEFRDDVARHVRVTKTDPTITGSAEFRIRPANTGRCIVEWTEAVDIPRLPRFMVPVARWPGGPVARWPGGPVARWFGRVGFRLALRRFAR